MPSFLDLLGIVAPVFLMLVVGWTLRRGRWLEPAADASLLRLGVYVFYPALIADTIIGNAALRNVKNVLLPAATASGSVLLGFAVAILAARLLRLPWPQPARTFAFTTGIFNYGFIPLPLISALFDRATLGVLFTYGLGVEFTLWSVGIALLSGQRGLAGLRSTLNAPIITIIVALALNAAGVELPEFLRTALQWLGRCAFPIQLVLTGSGLADLIRRDMPKVPMSAILGANFVRVGLLPMCMLGVAGLLSSAPELQRIAVIQAAMPCAMIPVMLAKHYKADSDLAAWIVATTTVVGMVSIPLWLRIGFWWVS